MTGYKKLFLTAVALTFVAGYIRAGDDLPSEFPPNPCIACSTSELRRLIAAYKTGQGAEFNVVARMVKDAEAAVGKDVKFPPRGGQHNTFYQCPDCQVALKTIDAIRHQCPVCHKEYSGSPYDDVVFARQHDANLRRMLASAWGYALTGEKRYADFSASILAGYAERYLDYPYHGSSRWNVLYNMLSGGRLYEQTLNEAVALALYFAPAYDLVYDTLSQDDIDRIHEKLFRPMLANIAKYNTGINNWQSWHNAAMVTTGIALRDTSWIRRGVYDPANGFLFQLENSITKDGMWYETSWAYHFYALRALVVTAEAGRRVGVDLWDSERFKSMFTLPVHYIMPDKSLPRFGDDPDSGLQGQSSLMEQAFNAYGDDFFLPFLPGKPDRLSVMFDRPASPLPARPELKSVLFEDTGHAILRTRGEAGLAAAITFGPFGGAHGHLDKLGFVFFGFGRELGVDPGRAASQAYRLPVHKDWYKATLGHNAIVVDGKSQKPARGELFLFNSVPEYAAVLAGCDTAYDNVQHRRLCVLFPEYLLVLDSLETPVKKEFEWFYHNTGEFNSLPDNGLPYDWKERGKGDSYIKDGMMFDMDASARVAFKSGQVATWVTMNVEEDTRMFVGRGPFRSVQNRVPLVAFARRGTNVLFGAALEPVRDGKTATVETVDITRGHAGRIEVLVTRAGGSDKVILAGEHLLRVSRGGEIMLEAVESRMQ